MVIDAKLNVALTLQLSKLKSLHAAHDPSELEKIRFKDPETSDTASLLLCHCPVTYTVSLPSYSCVTALLPLRHCPITMRTVYFSDD